MWVEIIVVELILVVVYPIFFSSGHIHNVNKRVPSTVESCLHHGQFSHSSRLMYRWDGSFFGDLMSHQCDTFVNLCFIQYSITLECIQMNLNCTANTTYQILIFDISWINPTMTWIWDLNFKSDISSIITIHINDPHTKVEMSLDYQIRPQHWTVCLSCNSVISQERINIIPSCHCWAHTTESNQFQSF